MKNSNALWYLSKKKIRGTVRNQFKSPLRIFISLALIIITIVILYFNIKNMSQLNTSSLLKDNIIMNAVIGVLCFGILGLLVFNKRNALVYLNDATFIFAGPFNQKQIALYMFVETFRQSIMIGMGYMLYVFLFFNPAIKGPLHALGIFIAMTLHYLFIASYFNLYYMKEASKDNPKRVNPLLFWVSLILILSFLLAIYLSSNKVFEPELINFTANHPLFKWIPFIGTSSWIANMFLLKDISALVPIVFLLISSFVLTHQSMIFKGDYFEKAILDAEFVTTQVRAVANKSLTDIENMQVDTDKVKKKMVKGDFESGALAIDSKNILVLKRTGKYISKQLIIALVISIAASFFFKDPIEYLQMIVFIVLFTRNNYDFEDELKRPFVFLIPDQPLKKVYALSRVKFLRVMVNNIALSLILLIQYQLPILMVLGIFLGLASFEVMSVASELLLLRIFTFKSNVIIKAYANFILSILVLIPAFVIAFIIYKINPLIDFNYLIFIFGLMNIGLGLLIIFFSKEVVMGSFSAD